MVRLEGEEAAVGRNATSEEEAVDNVVRREPRRHRRTFQVVVASVEAADHEGVAMEPVVSVTMAFWEEEEHNAENVLQVVAIHKVVADAPEVRVNRRFLLSMAPRAHAEGAVLPVLIHEEVVEGRHYVEQERALPSAWHRAVEAETVPVNDDGSLEKKEAAVGSPSPRRRWAHRDVNMAVDVAVDAAEVDAADDVAVAAEEAIEDGSPAGVRM